MAGISDPLEVKGYTFRNRIVMPPMASELATFEGEATDELVNHYKSRSYCTGLIVVEHSYVSVEGKLSPRQLGIHMDTLINSLSKVSSVIKGNGCLAVIQLNHAGGKANPSVTGTKPLAPSPVPVPGGYVTPSALVEKEIETVIDSFVKAASRAFKAGFDGVEIHGAHGFLLNQFLSPLTNKRRDSYGGTLENRMKFPLRVVREVRKLTGSKLLLYRLGADDLMPKGFTIDEAKKLSIKLVEEGVDIIDVSGGLAGSRPPELQGKQGYFVPLAEKIKKVTEAPVIGVGGIKDPYYADKIVREERVDLVAVGRAMLQNPNWACKALDLLKKN